MRSIGTMLLGTIITAAGGLLMYASRPRVADVVVVAIDASGSVGLDYSNRYIPEVSRLIDRLPENTLSRITRFGGQRELLFEGKLKPVVGAQLRNYLLSTSLFPLWVKGSPLSSEFTDQLTWLKQQRGRRKVLVLFTDGIEQGENRPQLSHGAPDTTILICYSRVPHPKVAELARLAGARVVVAQAPQAVQQAIEAEVFGRTMLTRVAPWLSALLAALGLAVITLAIVGWVRQRQVTPQPESLSLPGAHPLPQPLQLPTKRVEVIAQLVGYPAVSCRRMLRCNGIDQLIIARADMPGADLRLPPSLLGNLADVGLAIRISEGSLGMLRFHATNFGQVPIVVNGKVLHPGQGEHIPSQAELTLRLSPRHQIQLTARPIYEEALENAYSINN